MAELNWIDKNERLPKKEDAREGYVYTISRSGTVGTTHYQDVEHCKSSCTHWLPFASMSVPKRWRTPTIHDLAKAGKPIPCRIFGGNKWFDSKLAAIDVTEYTLRKFMDASGVWYDNCEICDE